MSTNGEGGGRGLTAGELACFSFSLCNHWVPEYEKCRAAWTTASIVVPNTTAPVGIAPAAAAVKPMLTSGIVLPAEHNVAYLRKPSSQPPAAVAPPSPSRVAAPNPAIAPLPAYISAANVSAHAAISSNNVNVLRPTMGKAAVTAASKRVTTNTAATSAASSELIGGGVAAAMTVSSAVQFVPFSFVGGGLIHSLYACRRALNRSPSKQRTPLLARNLARTSMSTVAMRPQWKQPPNRLPLPMGHMAVLVMRRQRTAMTTSRTQPNIFVANWQSLVRGCLCASSVATLW